MQRAAGEWPSVTGELAPARSGLLDLRHIPRSGRFARSLETASLKEGIRYAERDDVRSQAPAIGEKMRGEDGLATAVRAIEALVSHR